MKLMVTGAGGMLGSDIVTLAEAAAHEVTALDHDDLDITDGARVDQLVDRAGPRVIVNCAAWTDVDGAEASETEATRINAEGASNLSLAAARLGAAIVLPSTDYVFDGRKHGPYNERDEPDPISAYGRSKLAGEKATVAANRRNFIVRTSWLFGPSGGNFVDTMLQLARDRDQVLVVHDQVGCPTYTGHLAAGILRLVEGTSYGIHHMAGEGTVSWYEFAEEIFRRTKVDCEVLAATTDMVPRAAPRPANSALTSIRVTPIKLPPWERGLAEYLKRISAPSSSDQTAAEEKRE